MHLLILEWKKIKTYRPFWVLIGLYLVLLPGFFLSFRNSNIIPEQFGGTKSLYMFPGVWENFGYVGNWMSFFMLGFLAVLTISNEYSNRTLRQNLITGLSRKDFFLSKCYFITSLSLFATVYYAILSLIIGSLYTETVYMTKITEHLDMIPRYFIMCMGYTSIGLFLALWLRRSGIALFMYFSYGLFIEFILRFGVHAKLLDNKSMLFYPIKAASDCAPLIVVKNFINAAKASSSNSDSNLYLSTPEAMITSAIYTCIFLWAAYYFLQKRDL